MLKTVPCLQAHVEVAAEETPTTPRTSLQSQFDAAAGTTGSQIEKAQNEKEKEREEIQKAKNEKKEKEREEIEKAQKKENEQIQKAKDEKKEKEREEIEKAQNQEKERDAIQKAKNQKKKKKDREEIEKAKKEEEREEIEKAKKEKEREEIEKARQEKESRKRELHRESSRRWHAKWRCKGVPKEGAEVEGEMQLEADPDAAAEEALDAEEQQAVPEAEEQQAAPDAEEQQGLGDEEMPDPKIDPEVVQQARRLTNYLVDTPPLKYHFWMFKVGLKWFLVDSNLSKCGHLECYLQAITGDMRQVRAAYMKQWVAWANSCGQVQE